MQKVIVKWGSFDKILFQNRYFREIKVGQLFQSGAKVTSMRVSYFRVAQTVISIGDNYFKKGESNRLYTDMTLMNLQNEFDTINHKILLYKLLLKGFFEKYCHLV